MSSSGRRDKILTECGANPVGAVTSYATGSDGPAAMKVKGSGRVKTNKRVLTLGRVNRRVMEEDNNRSRKWM